ncbi:hypothetical protein [Paenibacillus sp. NAIST15-1]|uniref:hypothetical protein n=1 Tax=Paenibacillus sp. NAIST15-1 TaxID=1605994 RepID=UPI000868C619|nr:hypothetical protein [Paenibacillus sp. NAIST15-1]GAV11352.1 two-component system response regulator [Paenibacillus sp. NAIST15-1]
MSVRTTYDEKRDILKKTLQECLEQARELLDEDIWGYEEMREGYALDVYVAVKKAKDTV